MNINDGIRGGTICLSKAGLTTGDGSALGVGIAAPNGAGVDFAINGVLFHKADVATDAPLTADTAQGLLTTAIYLIMLNTSGTVSSKRSNIVTTAGLAAGSEQIQFPVPTVDTCPIGYVRIACTTTYNFTPGTTALSATGITETFVDLMTVPSMPLTA